MIYIINADGSDQRRLLFHRQALAYRDWSPDGSQIAFESERDGNPGIYITDADGGNQLRLTENEAEDWWPA